MVTIYYSLAYSHVVQSVIIWGGALKNMNKILRVILHVKTDNFHVPLLGSNEMCVMLELLKFYHIQTLTAQAVKNSVLTACAICFVCQCSPTNLKKPSSDTSCVDIGPAEC